MVNEWDASLVVDMASGLPRVFFPTNLMSGSGICGYSSANLSYTQVKTGVTSLGSRTQQVTGQAALGAFFLALMTLVF
jgi:alpha-amylase